MMPLKDTRALNDSIEQQGYIIGEMQDAIDREEPLFCDLIDAVAAGKVTPRDAKIIVRLKVAAWNLDLDQWRRIRAVNAKEANYRYLPESLKIASIQAPLPRVTA